MGVVQFPEVVNVKERHNIQIAAKKYRLLRWKVLNCVKVFLSNLILLRV
jgi:hypothetical protein